MDKQPEPDAERASQDEALSKAQPLIQALQARGHRVLIDTEAAALAVAEANPAPLLAAVRATAGPVGIASVAEQRARTLAIAAGLRERAPDEPRIWIPPAASDPA